MDQESYEAELATADRNLSLGHMMRSHGIIQDRAEDVVAGDGCRVDEPDVLETVSADAGPVVEARVCIAGGVEGRDADTDRDRVSAGVSADTVGGSGCRRSETEGERD